MAADTTLTMSEPISAQQTGIMLVWAAYVESGDGWRWSTDFIPKIALTAVGSGRGWSFKPGRAVDAADKYIYVSDTQLKGHADNMTAPNNKYVLRYVVGL